MRHLDGISQAREAGELAAKGASLLLAGSLVMAGCPCAWADEPAGDASDAAKDEVVYVKADAYGTAEGVYVVNVFPAGEAERVADPARYETVTNLTTEDDLEVRGGVVELTTLPDLPFYYQGDMRSGTELPWDIELSYFVDGVEVGASEAAGASGEVCVRLDVEPRGDDFSDSFLVQAQGTFPSERFRVTDAGQASVARVGNDVVVTALVLPGEDASFSIEGLASEFAWDGWQISAVPLSLVIDLKDQDTSELSAMAGQLEGGTAALAAGAATLDKGMGELAAGAGDLAAGTRALTDGIEAFRNGEEVERLVGLADAASELGSLLGGLASTAESLLSKWESLLDGADALAGSAERLEEALGSADGALDLTSADDEAALQSASKAAELGFQMAEEAYQQALGLIEEGSTPDNAQELADVAEELRAAAEEYREAKAAYREALASGQTGGAGTEALGEIIDEVRGLVDSAQSVCGLLHDCEDELRALLGAAKSLVGIAQGLADALEGLSGDVDSIMGGVDELSTGATAIADGSLLLYDSLAQAKGGTEQLSLGAGQLAGSVVGLDDKVLDELQRRIDEKLGASYIPHSFVVPENDNVNVVQFAYVIDGISAEVEEPQPAEETETKPGIWDRLIALFSF